MNEEQAIEQLNRLGSNDPESSHSTADQILLDFLKDNGFKTVAEAWERASDRAGFWYS